MPGVLNWFLPTIIILGFLGIWQSAVWMFQIPQWLLPTPSAIAIELVNSRVLLWEHTIVTIQEIIIGFLFALVAGISLALSISYSRLMEKSLYPFVVASQTIPIIAIAPLLLIWVGYGIAAKVIVVALICFFPITVNLVDGLKSVDSDMVNMMNTLGGSRWQLFTKLQIPSSLPFLFSGLKIGVAVSVIAAVIGEWVGASAGLGYLMTLSIPYFLTARVFAAIVVLSILGVSLFLFTVLLEKITLPWYHTEKRGKSLHKTN